LKNTALAKASFLILYLTSPLSPSKPGVQAAGLRAVCLVSSGPFDVLDAVNDHAGNNDALFYFASLKLALLYARQTLCARFLHLILRGEARDGETLGQTP